MSIPLNILITTLSIISFLAILAVGFGIYYYFTKRRAIEYTFLNTKACGKKFCKAKIKDFNTIPLQKDMDFNLDVAKYCADLIYRIEMTSREALHEPKGLTKILNLWNTKLEPLFGILWWDSDSKVAYIIFRGTYDSTEWMEDFQYNQETLPTKRHDSQVLFDLGPVVKEVVNKPMIHGGFRDIYLKFKDILLAKLNTLTNINKIIISGHSMGAAVATICGVDILQLPEYANKITVYNFASPRVGDPGFVEFVNTINLTVYQIVNTLDTIPQLPPPIAPNFRDPTNPYYFEHCGKAKYFTANWKSIVNNHLMAAYMQGLDNLS